MHAIFSMKLKKVTTSRKIRHCFRICASHQHIFKREREREKVRNKINVDGFR